MNVTVILKDTISANCVSGRNCYLRGGSVTNIASNGYNLSSDGSLSSDPSAARRNTFTQTGDQNFTDPQLAPLTNNGGPTLTHIPKPGSKAIDNGNDCPDTDERGAPRPIGGNGIPICDIGLVEHGTKLPWLYLPLMLT